MALKKQNEGIQTENLPNNVVCIIDRSKLSAEQIQKLYPTARYGSVLTGKLDGEEFTDVSTGLTFLKKYEGDLTEGKWFLKMKSGLLAACPTWSASFEAGKTVRLKKGTFNTERLNSEGVMQPVSYPFATILV